MSTGKGDKGNGAGESPRSMGSRESDKEIQLSISVANEEGIKSGIQKEVGSSSISQQ